MEKILSNLNRSLEIMEFCKNKGWRIEEIAGTIELLHSEINRYSSVVEIPALETVEK